MVCQYFSTADQLGGLDDGPQMYLSDWQLWNDNMRKRRRSDLLRSIGFQISGWAMRWVDGMCQGAGWQRSYSCKKKILPDPVTPDVYPPLCDGISDISPKTKLEIVANRKEQGWISIPPHNGAGGKKAEAVKLPKYSEGGGAKGRDEKMEKDEGANEMELISWWDEVLRWCTDVSVRQQLSDQTICLPPNTPIKPLRNCIFTSSCTLSTIFQIENKSIDHDFLLLAGKVVLVVRMKLISGSCVSMNSEAGLQRRSYNVLIAEQLQWETHWQHLSTWRGGVGQVPIIR